MLLKWLLLATLISGCFVAPAAGAATDRPGENGAQDSLVVPGFTAYIEPDPGAATVADPAGVSAWSNAQQTVNWYGRVGAAGMLHISLQMRLPAASVSKLRMKVSPTGSGAGDGAVLGSFGARATGSDQRVNVDFGVMEITAPGYYRFSLAGVSRSGPTFGDVEGLLLSGSAVKDAHFNLKGRRNAASVHLWYTTPPGAQIQWFYNEVTVRTDPLWSYYMACGFSRGYFGIQVNSPTERRIIFSVWDSGKEPVDRSKVAAADQVQLLAKGPDVYASGFGNEGTGGHSHLVYPWQTGATYRFLVSAQPEGTATVYSGYFYFPEKEAWGLIASFRAPSDGGYLRGLYSFNEDFIGDNGEEQRRAEFGPQWIKTADGAWTELTEARFTHDGTGNSDRLDYSAGAVRDRFYLANGGFTPSNVTAGTVLKRQPSRSAPPEITLPTPPPINLPAAP
ncbi:MAG: DUF3472 domain-containing protein [Chloroflexi bacterium]|nr:DUF3472 domain-containing protein [Chloroflexota bacterium]